MFWENPANGPWDDVTYHYNPLWSFKITGEFRGKFGVSSVLERHPYQSLKACPHQHVRLDCPIPESKFSRIMCELIVQEPPINPRIVQKDFRTFVIQTRKLKGNEKGFMMFYDFVRRGTETVKWLAGKGQLAHVHCDKLRAVICKENLTCKGCNSWDLLAKQCKNPTTIKITVIATFHILVVLLLQVCGNPHPLFLQRPMHYPLNGIGLHCRLTFCPRSNHWHNQGRRHGHSQLAASVNTRKHFLYSCSHDFFTLNAASWKLCNLLVWDKSCFKAHQTNSLFDGRVTHALLMRCFLANVQTVLEWKCPNCFRNHGNKNSDVAIQ